MGGGGGEGSHVSEQWLVPVGGVRSRSPPLSGEGDGEGTKCIWVARKEGRGPCTGGGGEVIAGEGGRQKGRR